MRSRVLLIFSLTLLAASPVMAAPPVPKSTPPPEPTLAQALLAAPPPTSGLVLTVGAEHVPLPLDTEMPAADASLADIATAFGERTDTFGSVTVIAPATKVALNENPGPPDIPVDLKSSTIFEMLAASLDDTQWKALTSEIGLGLTDLTNDSQKALFHGLLRQGRLWVASSDPGLAKLPEGRRTDIKDVSDQIDGIRLRLGQTSNIDLHDKKNEPIYFSGTPLDAAAKLHTWHPEQEPQDAERSVLLRTVIPNTPRDGDLRPDTAQLRVSVTWAGAKTVGDLIIRIATLTHQEIYTDPRYANKTLTVIGSGVAAPAGDWLRAIALAVAGTYRQVGPAYVLTDDITGVGTRRQRLLNWEKAADVASSKIRDEAGLTMLTRRASTARTLPALDDPLALTPTQMAAQKGDDTMAGVPSILGTDVPFSTLTPAQQTWGRQIASDYEDQRNKSTLPSYLAEDSPQEPDLNGKVSLGARYQVQFIVPGIAVPVDTDLKSAVSLLYWPGETTSMQLYWANAAKKPAPILPPAPPLAAVLKSRSRRAVLGHPRTPADVDALILAMQKLGLNELWLDIFSDGVAHTPNSRLSSKTIPVGTDILAEALTKAQGTGIAVYADMQLLHWGGATPDSARDLTILGETNVEFAINAHDRDPKPQYDDVTMKEIAFAPPPLVVSPKADQVRGDLSEIVRFAAAHSGLAGFVWRDAEDDGDLGYTSEMRLAFLRATHSDPVDLIPINYSKVDVTLPTFDDDPMETKLAEQWTKARKGSLLELLKQMRWSMTPPVSKLSVLMGSGKGYLEWLASWDEEKSLPPPLRSAFEEKSFHTLQEFAALARTQSKFILLRENVVNDGDTDSLARTLKAGLGDGKWDGYVLDFRREEVTQGNAPLDSLVRAVYIPSKAPRNYRY